MKSAADRLRAGARWVTVAALLLAQMGGPGRSSLDRLEQAVRRPLPALPPVRLAPNDRVWVPDRYVGSPAGTVHVPGHWEQRLNDQETAVPPLVACTTDGRCLTLPGGTRPAPEYRQAP
ncbi:MAG TPA: hypothetical protein VNK50_11420 [Calidithermus sp.]|nr:hypothetical protein [Calidithermus sp.]